MEVIADRLQELLDREGIAATREAVEYVARAADGSMRDGLSILEQCISYHLGEELTLDKVLAAIGAVDVEVYIQLFECLKEKDLVGALKIIDEAIWQGKDLLQLVNEFTAFIRNILVLSIDPDMTIDVTAHGCTHKRYDTGLDDACNLCFTGSRSEDRIYDIQACDAGNRDHQAL